MTHEEKSGNPAHAGKEPEPDSGGPFADIASPVNFDAAASLHKPST